MKSRYAGGDWAERQGLRCITLRGKAIADIMGEVFRGIYHMDPNDLEASDFDAGIVRVNRSIATWDFDFATWDFDHLLTLVVLATDEGFRLEICPRSNSTMTIRFHLHPRGDNPMEELPLFDDMVASIRGRVVP